MKDTKDTKEHKGYKGTQRKNVLIDASITESLSTRATNRVEWRRFGRRRLWRRRETAAAAMPESCHRHADERGCEVAVRHDDQHVPMQPGDEHVRGCDQQEHAIGTTGLQVDGFEAAK